jgi:hypothetical protein
METVMVSDMPDIQASDRPPMEYVVRCILEQSGAIRADQIAIRISLKEEAILEELNRLVGRGLVEILRPIAVTNGNANESEEANRPCDYYRWIRPTDMDYLWQSNLLARDPILLRDSPLRSIDLLTLMNL